MGREPINLPALGTLRLHHKIDESIPGMSTQYAADPAVRAVIQCRQHSSSSREDSSSLAWWQGRGGGGGGGGEMGAI